jgi:hypothetical protein
MAKARTRRVSTALSLFQGFYAFSITPMTSLYPTEVSQFKLRATSVAIFRMLDSGFGSVHPRTL